MPEIQVGTPGERLTRQSLAPTCNEHASRGSHPHPWGIRANDPINQADPDGTTCKNVVRHFFTDREGPTGGNITIRGYLNCNTNASRDTWFSIYAQRNQVVDGREHPGPWEFQASSSMKRYDPANYRVASGKYKYKGTWSWKVPQDTVDWIDGTCANGFLVMRIKSYFNWRTWTQFSNGTQGWSKTYDVVVPGRTRAGAKWGCK